MWRFGRFVALSAPHGKGGGFGNGGGMARFGSAQILCAPEGDGGGGAGAAGGAAGGQQLIDTVNSAVTAQLKREIGKIQFGPMIAEQLKQLTPDLTKSIVGAVVEQVGAGLDEKLKSLAPGAGAGAGAGGKGKEGAAGAGGALPPELQNTLAQMQAQMKTMGEQLAEKDKQLKATAEATAKKEEDDLIRGSLKAAGVAEPLIEGAAAMLRQRGVVKRKEDGSIIVPVSRNQHGQQFTEELGIPQFISEWAKSTEGQSYLPARRVGGGGPGGQGNGRNPTAPGVGGVQQQPGVRIGQAGGERRAGEPPRTAEGKVDYGQWDREIGEMALGLATGQVVDDVGG